MEEALISVIIPVYNTEMYLRECLETVRCQTYSNLEILIVDDGSTDGSARICKEYCDKDPRFHLIRDWGKRGIPGSTMPVVSTIVLWIPMIICIHGMLRGFFII